MNAPPQRAVASTPLVRRRDPRWLLALAVAFHLSLLLSWRVGFWNAFTFDSVATRGERGWDFFALYQAGHNVLTGVSAYESDNEAIEVVVPRYTPFRYLPVSAYTAGVALNALPPLWSFRVWVALSELLLLGCAALSWRLAPDRRRGAVMAAMWLCFTPYYLEIYLGQFNVVQAALVLVMMAAAAPPPSPTLPPEYRGEGAGVRPTALPAEYRGEGAGVRPTALPPEYRGEGAGVRPTALPAEYRGEGTGVRPTSSPRYAGGALYPTRIQEGGWSPDEGAPLFLGTGRGGRSRERGMILGVAWVLSLLWKQNTGLYVPLLARQRRWRLLGMAALAVAATSLPYFLAQPGSLAAFLGNLSSGAPAPNLGNLGVRQFLYSLASALAPGLTPHAHLWLQRGWVVAAIAAGLALTLRDRRPPTLLHLCLWTSTYFLVYHHVWEHHYLLALPVLVMLYLRDGSPWVLALWALLAVWTPYILMDPQGMAAHHAPMRWTPLEPAILDVVYHGSKALPALGLWAYVVAAILRRGTSHETPAAQVEPGTTSPPGDRP